MPYIPGNYVTFGAKLELGAPKTYGAWCIAVKHLTESYEAPLKARAGALAGAVLLLLCVLDAEDRDAQEVVVSVCAGADRGGYAVGYYSGAVDMELESLYGRLEYGWGLVGEDFWGEEVQGDECDGVDLWAGRVL
ncbi:hypothetical protein V498_07522 [Pseudogymnoascus sp. VKM F-4517 (FW-2822)]|nr:hypothetical protein V498_07522 [Pseudogymnoascus sp. VKM F-4517 (FW-2822)]